MAAARRVVVRENTVVVVIASGAALVIVVVGEVAAAALLPEHPRALSRREKVHAHGAPAAAHRDPVADVENRIDRRLHAQHARGVLGRDPVKHNGPGNVGAPVAEGRPRREGHVEVRELP